MQRAATFMSRPRVRAPVSSDVTAVQDQKQPQEAPTQVALTAPGLCAENKTSWLSQVTQLAFLFLYKLNMHVTPPTHACTKHT